MNVWTSVLLSVILAKSSVQAVYVTLNVTITSNFVLIRVLVERIVHQDVPTVFLSSVAAQILKTTRTILNVRRGS